MTTQRAMKFRLFLCLVLFVSPASLAATNGPISEETPPAACDPGSVVSEVRCTGSYCDNLQISCVRLGADLAGASRWTAWVSEEQGGTRACPDNSYIAGFACNGKYCDNLSLYCVEFPRVLRRSCNWTRSVSEESGGQLSFFQGDAAGQRFAATGVKCTGSYCDNKTFDVCEIALP